MCVRTASLFVISQLTIIITLKRERPFIIFLLQDHLAEKNVERECKQQGGLPADVVLLAKGVDSVKGRTPL